MKPSDPAYWMLKDGFASKPQVYRESCYICNDPEFAAMGLPLCRPCPECSKTEGKIGHIPADDEKCSECGAYEEEPMEAEEAG